jgi:hypothetical protein
VGLHAFGVTKEGMEIVLSRVIDVSSVERKRHVIHSICSWRERKIVSAQNLLVWVLVEPGHVLHISDISKDMFVKESLGIF